MQDRIENLESLGAYIRENSEALQAIKVQARLHNPWFTIDNIDHALQTVASSMLDEEILQAWVSGYDFGSESKRIGLILAGNIPLVGFHDLLCCYLSGHKAIVKASSKDSVLTLHLLEKLNAGDAFQVVERLSGMEAVIATGSNHSAEQFERYFSKYPRIIRRNRNAVSVLGGKMSEGEILALGRDVFTYFGLGCRNVAKVYIPEDFNKQSLMEVLHEEYKTLVNHTKYKNNYDYNHAIFLLNQEEFLASGAVLLRKHEDIISRIACLHYEEYEDRSLLRNELIRRSDEIQCISGNVKLDGIDILPLGKCQQPAIDDYADGVDTIEFLAELSRR